MKLLIYLASPYSHDDPKVEQERFEKVCLKASELFEMGYLVFSPIAHSHMIAKFGGLPGDYPFWHEYAHRMIKSCDCFWVYCIDGWKESEGIADEMELARELKKEVHYVEEEKETNELQPKDT